MYIVKIVTYKRSKKGILNGKLEVCVVYTFASVNFNGNKKNGQTDRLSSSRRMDRLRYEVNHANVQWLKQME